MYLLTGPAISSKKTQYLKSLTSSEGPLLALMVFGNSSLPELADQISLQETF